MREYITFIFGNKFDGPVGVYMALNAAENFKSTSSKQYGNLKTVIYACEESTRFSSACLGSCLNQIIFEIAQYEIQ